jgi:choline monooxygenase
VAAAGIDVDELRFHHRSEFEVGANWKIACENFLECYHCPVAHPGFSAVIDVSPDAYKLEAGETFLSQYTTARAGAHDGYDPNGEIEYGQFHLLWPNVVVNVAPGRPNLSIGPIVPVGPDRTTRFLDYLFGADVDEEWIQGLVAFDDQVGREDSELVASVQRGLQSGMVERGRLLLNSEHLIADFQRRIAEALA